MRDGEMMTDENNFEVWARSSGPFWDGSAAYQMQHQGRAGGARCTSDRILS